MRQFGDLRKSRGDILIGAVIFALTLVLYVRTLAPSVVFLFDDTLDFQTSIPRLGIAHQTGYPLYTLLGKLFTLIVPINDAAFRLNLFSAICAALAVTTLYFLSRRITRYQAPALLAALVFAVSPAFWEQALLAEVYALQMFLTALVLLLAIRHSSPAARHSPLAMRAPRHHSLYALAFVMGLGLAHHRLILLIYPAIVIYVLLVRRNLLRDFAPLGRAAVLFLSPLLLYLYLPLRGAVGSADGTYENTWQGLWAWITASQYTVFLTQNPLNLQRDAAFFATLFQNQFTLAGVVLAAIGFIALFRQNRRAWILLTLALVPAAGFAFNYHVADVDVFFLTTFLLTAVFAGAGADALLEAISDFGHLHSCAVQVFQISERRFSLSALRFLLSALFLLIPLQLLVSNYQSLDLSAKWEVHDYGVDILSQPLESNATIVGILGEVTLFRYFQENANLRPDVQTLAADREGARFAAIERALEQNRAVYLTRPLKGAEQKYSLASLGPLIRVENVLQPPISNPQSQIFADLGAGIRLLGYDLDSSRLTGITGRWHAENGRVLRVTLYWQATDRVAADAIVSLKVLRKDRVVVGQIDRRPVLDAYPTTAWRKDEIIADTYDVPIFLGAPPGEYALNLTVYDAKSSAVIGQRDLQTIVFAPEVIASRREMWNIAHPVGADFGEIVLEGFSFDKQTPVRPGDLLSLTHLWRSAREKIADGLTTRVWLEDDAGKSVASRDAPVGGGFPVSHWQAGQFVRDAPLIRVPANVADGKFRVKLAVARGEQMLGSSWVPFHPTVVDLGQVEIKNRPRMMSAPNIAHPIETAFEGKIKLLGYDAAFDAPTRQVRLTLYWKSLALMNTSYTVFLHLLDASSVMRASEDTLPGGGELPTTGWIENEYIVDQRAISFPKDLPAGRYAIEMGLYDAATGVRLKTGDGQERIILTFVEIP